MTISIPIVVDSEAEEPEVFTVGVSLVSVSEGLVLGQIPDNQPVIILDANGKNYKKYISMSTQCKLHHLYTTFDCFRHALRVKPRCSLRADWPF